MNLLEPIITLTPEGFHLWRLTNPAGADELLAWARDTANVHPDQYVQDITRNPDGTTTITCYVHPIRVTRDPVTKEQINHTEDFIVDGAPPVWPTP